jgi:D-lyxose ketol-isomerase
MKRSAINALIRSAQSCYNAHGWALPPNARWDVTDFGRGDWQEFGLVLVNLAEEPEYCEKLMYARKGMTTPAHCHRKKKEDIICRWGRLAVRVWAGPPDDQSQKDFKLAINHEPRTVHSNQVVELEAGSRVTLIPGIYHEFWPLSDECIIGEVSTANDDLHDNCFADKNVGRYPGIEEDEPATLRLISDQKHES